MARTVASFRPGILFLALAIAVFLWGVANGSTSIELGIDVPVELVNTPEALVVTDQNVDAINVRVFGSRAAVLNIATNKLTYRIDASGGKPGVADYEVDVWRVDLPTGVKALSRSPSRVQVRFEEKGRKVVPINADLTGQVAPGYKLGSVTIVPPRLWITGARSQVYRIEELSTDALDVTGLTKSIERDVRVRLSSGTVWLEEEKPVKVLVEVVPPEVEPEAVEEESEETVQG